MSDSKDPPTHDYPTHNKKGRELTQLVHTVIALIDVKIRRFLFQIPYVRSHGSLFNLHHFSFVDDCFILTIADWSSLMVKIKKSEPWLLTYGIISFSKYHFFLQIALPGLLDTCYLPIMRDETSNKILINKNEIILKFMTLIVVSTFVNIVQKLTQKSTFAWCINA